MWEVFSLFLNLFNDALKQHGYYSVEWEVSRE